MNSKIKINNSEFFADITDDSWFWGIVNEGSWEPHTLNLIDHFVTEDWRFVDIGAWIGPTALFAATKCNHVDAYECDPEALRRLRRNIRANRDFSSKIFLHPHALSDSDGSVRIFSRGWGNSESSVLSRHERDGDVLQLTDSLLVGSRDIQRVFLEQGYTLDEKAFIKIDVEGAEFSLIPHLAEIIVGSKCVWHISFHEINLNNDHMPSIYLRVAEVIRSLLCFASLGWYTEKLAPIDKELFLDKVLAGEGMPEKTLLFRA